MAQVSSRPIPEKIYQRILEIFSQSLIKLKNKKEVEDFINDFLTPTEKIMLAKRLAIAFLLEKKYNYRSISEILRVSLPTISSVSLMKKLGGEGYRRVMSKLLEEESIKDFLMEMGEVVSGGLGKSSKGGAAWRYLHQKLKQKRKEKPF